MTPQDEPLRPPTTPSEQNLGGDDPQPPRIDAPAINNALNSKPIEGG